MPDQQISSERLQYLGTLSNDALLEDLGSALFENDAGGLARPPKAAELIERATAWLKDQSGAVTIRVCGSAELRGLVEHEPSNREKVIVKIIDILATKYSGFPLATIGELLFRSGVSSYCASHWAASRGVT
jgi:hypothetical protein